MNSRAALALLGASLAALLLPDVASAVCRVVEPSRDSGDPGVAFDPRTSALYVLAPDQVVDVDCADGSVPVPDGGDNYHCDDGEPGAVTRDSLVSLVVQPSILAMGGTAGLIMPVAARPDVATGSSELLRAAAALEVPTIHETVVVHEDPSLGHQCSDPHYSRVIHPAELAGALWGCGEYYRPGTEGRATTTVDYSDAGSVELETISTTDAYDVTVLSASSLEALSAWLDDNGFAHSAVDDDAFGAYVGEGHWFVAVHVHPDASGLSLALDPIVVTWRGAALPLQHRLQYSPHGGVLTTDAWVLAPSRVDAADGSAFTLYAAPAEVGDGPLAGFGLSHGWLTRIEATRISSNYLDDSELVLSDAPEELRGVIERRTDARIAAPCCPGGATAVSDPAAYRTYEHERTYLASEAPAIPDEWLGSTPSPGAQYCGGETFGILESETRPDLRGCAVSRGPLREAVLGWGPIAFALAVLVWRRRSK